MTTNDFSANPIGTLRVARRNPLAAAMGALTGMVPVGAYYMGHCQLTSWDPRTDWHALIVYAALVFSVSTVAAFSSALYGHWVKGLCFTVVLEGLMMTCDTPWLAIPALVLLVAINATYCGCRLALRDAAQQVEATTLAEARASDELTARERAQVAPGPRPMYRAMGRVVVQSPRPTPVALVR